VDQLLPDTVEADDRPAPDPRLQPADRRADEDSILKHIADALRLDEA
jgi:hypothetical protein